MLEVVAPSPPADVAAELTALRSRADVALRSALAGAGPVLILAPGDGRLIDAPAPSLRPVGIALDAPPTASAGSVVEAVRALTGAPMGGADELDASLTSLVLQVRAVAEGGLAVLTIPADASGSDLVESGAALGEALAALDDRVALVLAGDLSPCLTEKSPGYLVDGADEWNLQAVDAIRGADAPALAELGPAEAERTRAAGWAPLVVGMAAVAAAGGATSLDAAYATPRGVGSVVASVALTGEAGPEPGAAAAEEPGTPVAPTPSAPPKPRREPKPPLAQR